MSKYDISRTQYNHHTCRSKLQDYFCGDYRQTDLKWDDEREGIHKFMKILSKMPKYFSCIEFMENDIVRSGLVKDFIIKKNLIENGIIVQHASTSFSPAQALHTPQKDP